MAKNKRKWIIIGSILLFISIVVSVLNYYTSRVYWKYDEKWILGRHRNEIIERYGEFDMSFGTDHYGYFIYNDGKVNSQRMDTGKNMYYYVVFNIDDIAIKTYVGGHPGG